MIALVPHAAADAQRQQRVHHAGEQRCGPQGLRRVAFGVVVLRREGRHDLDAVRRPAHEVEPDQREQQPAAGSDVPCHVRAVPIAVMYGRNISTSRGISSSPTITYREPDSRPHAEDVEGPDQDDQADADHDRQGEVEAGAGVGPVAPEASASAWTSEPATSPLMEGTDRPADPVAEHHQQADQHQVFRHASSAYSTMPPDLFGTSPPARRGCCSAARRGDRDHPAARTRRWCRGLRPSRPARRSGRRGCTARRRSRPTMSSP